MNVGLAGDADENYLLRRELLRRRAGNTLLDCYITNDCSSCNDAFFFFTATSSYRCERASAREESDQFAGEGNRSAQMECDGHRIITSRRGHLTIPIFLQGRMLLAKTSPMTNATKNNNVHYQAKRKRRNKVRR